MQVLLVGLKFASLRLSHKHIKIGLKVKYSSPLKPHTKKLNVLCYTCKNHAGLLLDIRKKWQGILPHTATIDSPV
jgi:hypothetical protein